MRSLRFHFLTLLASCAVAAPARAQLHVAVRVSPVADLAHQLDCVTFTIDACGAADYRQLWRERFVRDAADSAALNGWRALRARYETEAEVDTSSRDLVGRHQRAVSLAEKWRVAGLQARTFDDYQERLALVLLPQDRARVGEVLARFRPRFVEWWNADARDRLGRGRDSLDVLLAGAELRGLLDRARRFYGATGPGSDTVTLTLVARPGLTGRGTSAEVVDGWAVQEVLPLASPAREVPVTLHEVAHLMLSLAPDSAREAMAAKFARGGVAGRAARSLIDEGLATAFGNGLVERAMRPPARFASFVRVPLSMYNDSIIDMAGKALYPTLDSLLAAGATLADVRTVDALRDALAAGLGPRLTSPRALLHDVWGFIDDRVTDPRAVANAMRHSLRPGHFSVRFDSAGGLSADHLARDPWIGGLVVAHPASIARVAARGAFRTSEVAAIRRAAAAGPTLYGARRANGARTWVIVARTSAEAKALVEKLAALDRDADGAVR